MNEKIQTLQDMMTVVAQQRDQALNVTVRLQADLLGVRREVEKMQKDLAAQIKLTKAAIKKAAALIPGETTPDETALETTPQDETSLPLKAKKANAKTKTLATEGEVVEGGSNAWDEPYREI